MTEQQTPLTYEGVLTQSYDCGSDSAIIDIFIFHKQLTFCKGKHNGRKQHHTRPVG